MGHMATVWTIVDLIDYDASQYEDGITFFISNDKRWINLDKKSSLEINDRTCWKAIGGGRWVLSSDSIVHSSEMPTGGAAKGTRWVWEENNLANEYDSMITYFYTGSTWKELTTRMRLYDGNPDSLGLSPNSDREEWMDTSSGVVYHAYNGGWVV